MRKNNKNSMAPNRPSLVSINAFTLSDWPALWVIHLAHLAEDGIIIDPSMIPDRPRPDLEQPYEWDFHHIEELYLGGAGNFWIAHYAGQPAGFMGGQDLGGVIEVRRVYVVASLRRQGIGRALMYALIQYSRVHSVAAIEVWTGVNGLGRKLYEACGFQVTAQPGLGFADESLLAPYIHTRGADEIRLRLEL
jgi:GNAT superfamily N-acetyltransferase